jgi:hypothetical protein
MHFISHANAKPFVRSISLLPVPARISHCGSEIPARIPEWEKIRSARRAPEPTKTRSFRPFRSARQTASSSWARRWARRGGGGGQEKVVQTHVPTPTPERGTSLPRPGRYPLLPAWARSKKQEAGSWKWSAASARVRVGFDV